MSVNNRAAVYAAVYVLISVAMIIFDGPPGLAKGIALMFLFAAVQYQDVVGEARKSTYDAQSMTWPVFLASIVYWAIFLLNEEENVIINMILAPIGAGLGAIMLVSLDNWLPPLPDES